MLAEADASHGLMDHVPQLYPIFKSWRNWAPVLIYKLDEETLINHLTELQCICIRKWIW